MTDGKINYEQGLTFDNMSANAMILILAGSETTATLLSGCIYLLLSNPEKLEMLQREVRSTYKSDGDITLNNVNDLTFMLAVLNESLRLYPPVPSSLVRVVPAGGETIMDDFIPGGVSWHSDNYLYLLKSFHLLLTGLYRCM